MSNESNMMKVYFDDAGNTGENLDDPDQRNLFLAAVAIPGEVIEEFGARVGQAWDVAARQLGVPPSTVELKGEHLYGGKGLFKGTEGAVRLEILEAVFSALMYFEIRVYWDGLPKHEWKNDLQLRGQDPKDRPFWKLTLLTFCNGLYKLLSALYPNGQLFFAGDENSWVKAHMLLGPRNSDQWSQLHGGSIGFYRSSDVRGIQIADIVVNTLYRANRDQIPRPGTEAPPLSNTDLTAKDFHTRLAAKDLWVNVTTALRQINDVESDSS